MDNTELFNIKERYEKIYILADENTHKLLLTMKEDILTLINAVEQPAQSHELDAKSYLIGRFDNSPREWQELTRDEIPSLWVEAHNKKDNLPIPVIFASLVNQALKEKNHG